MDEDDADKRIKKTLKKYKPNLATKKERMARTVVDGRGSSSRSQRKQARQVLEAMDIPPKRYADYDPGDTEQRDALLTLVRGKMASW